MFLFCRLADYISPNHHVTYALAENRLISHSVMAHIQNQKKMPVELKDLAEYLGYTDEQLKEFADADALKADVDKQFIRRENASKDKDFMKSVNGKLLNSLETKFISTAKDYGIEFNPEETKGVALEKLFEGGFSKLSTASATALKAVEDKIGKPDEVVKEWEGKYNNVLKERDDFKGLLEKTKIEFTGFKEQKETEIKGAKLSFQKEQLLSNVPWKAGIKDIEKQGFLSIVDKSAKFDFDNEGKFIVTDLEGHLIPSKAKHGEFVKPDEYIKELGLKSEVIAVNPHSNGKQVQKQFTPPPPQQQAQVQEPQGRQINNYRPGVSQR